MNSNDLESACTTRPAPTLTSNMMSPQLTLSSLFCVLALAALCVVASVRDFTGANYALTAPAALTVQAELALGLLGN
ncbi:MAG: hypothetical protein ACXIT4_05840 [Erythrobacter sp.]